MARAVAGARLELTEEVVLSELRAEQGEQRLDEREIDDLPPSGRFARPQRGQDGECGRERGHAVGQRERREERRPVGLAVQRREAAHRLCERPEARA